MAFVVTAIAAAVEVGTVAAIATAVSEVGIALSVVGAVTGNKELMKIGGVLGIAGGIGGLAASFATGATEAAVGGVAASGAADATAGAVANEAATAADYANGADLASDAMTKPAEQAAESALAPAGGTLSAPSIAPQTATDMASLAPTMQAAPTTQTATLGAQSPAGAIGPAGAQAPIGAQAPYTPWEADFPTSTANSSSNASGSLFDQFSGWVKANPKLAELGLQVVGGSLKGMSDYSLAQQKLAQQEELIKQQSYGNQVGTWSPVNATPGIIGGARTNGGP